MPIESSGTSRNATVSKVVGARVKRLLVSAAVIIVVAVSAATFIHPFRTPLTLSPQELRLKTRLPIGSEYTPSSEREPHASFDAKRCMPKALSFGKTPSEVHFKKGEKPTGSLPVVAFQILESGDVANVILKQSSGIRDTDNLALAWVKGSKYNNRPGCGIIESEVGVTIDF